MKKKTILIFVHYYLPGYKGGGPIRSISHIIELLKDDFNFYVITSDRDIGDEKPYKNVRVNAWNEYRGYNIFYANKNSSIVKVIKEIEFDDYYFNSLFDYRKPLHNLRNTR